MCFVLSALFFVLGWKTKHKVLRSSASSLNNLLYRRIRVSPPGCNFISQPVKHSNRGITCQNARQQVFTQQLDNSPAGDGAATFAADAGSELSLAKAVDCRGE